MKIKYLQQDASLPNQIFEKIQIFMARCCFPTKYLKWKSKYLRQDASQQNKIFAIKLKYLRQDLKIKYLRQDASLLNQIFEIKIQIFAMKIKYLQRDASLPNQIFEIKIQIFAIKIKYLQQDIKIKYLRQDAASQQNHFWFKARMKLEALLPSGRDKNFARIEGSLWLVGIGCSQLS